MTRPELMAGRPGFSLLELLVVLTFLSIIATVTMPALGRSLSQLRLQRAATVVVSKLQLARSTAARQRAPVRLSIDTAAKVIRVRDYADPSTVFAEQWLDASAEAGVQGMTVSDTSLMIYPNGLVEKQLEIVLRAAGHSRRIRMSRTGQMRIMP